MNDPSFCLRMMGRGGKPARMCFPARLVLPTNWCRRAPVLPCDVRCGATGVAVLPVLSSGRRWRTIGADTRQASLCGRRRPAVASRAVGAGARRAMAHDWRWRPASVAAWSAAARLAQAARSVLASGRRGRVSGGIVRQAPLYGRGRPVGTSCMPVLARGLR